MADKEQKFTIEEAKKLSPKFLLRLINKAKEYLKTNDVFQDLCKEYGVEVDIIDVIPVKFGEIDVSGKCDHGVITLNYKLLCDGDFFKDYSYLVHESCHFFQQCFGDKATPSANNGDYLYNPAEQEGFQKQVEYIADEYGEHEANDYVDNLLEHHEKDGKEKEKLKDVLMDKV